jgi:hypothetical protein
MKSVKLKRTGGIVAAAFIAAITGYGAMQMSPVGAASDAKTKQVKGNFTLQFYPPGPNCTPWAGACLKGTATGELSGEVFIRVNNSYMVDGSARTVSVSNADITITRPNGDELKGAAAGSLDRTSGEFHNVTSWVGGTGAYAEATGFVHVDGFDDPSGIEHSSYRGTLVLPKR